MAPCRRGVPMNKNMTKQKQIRALIKEFKKEMLIVGLTENSKPIYSLGYRTICKEKGPLNKLAVLLGYPSFFHWIGYSNRWDSMIKDFFYEAEVYTKDLDNEDANHEKNKKRLG